MFVTFLYVFGTYWHVTAFCFLIIYMLRTKSCEGLSLKTQLLFLITFTSRYLDIFGGETLILNENIKIIFLALTCGTVFLIYWKYYKTYEAEYDNLLVEPLVIVCLILAVFTTSVYNILEVLWIFSRYLEVIAILPQMRFTKNRNRRDIPVLVFVLMLAVYRLSYIIHWVERYYYTEYYDPVMVIPGTNQFMIHCVFLFLYFSIPKDTVPVLPIVISEKVKPTEQIEIKEEKKGEVRGSVTTEVEKAESKGEKEESQKLIYNELNSTLPETEDVSISVPVPVHQKVNIKE